MKKVLALASLVATMNLTAQISEVSNTVKKAIINSNDTIDGWKTGGAVSLQINQSAFSNWVAGGVNNVAGNLHVNYNILYKKDAWIWNNKIILSYGLSKNQGQDMRKTDDRIELNSLLGRNAFGNWSYSFFTNFRTQFTDGYDYNATEDLPNGKTYEDYPTSRFFKPAYLTFGPGLLWEKNDRLYFNLAPLTSKVTFLSGEVFKYDGKRFVSSKETAIFGVEPGESMLYELGFYAAGYYHFNLMDNVDVENILSLYSNYLDNPQYVDVDYTMNVTMKINKYLSTNLSVQTIYDKNASSKLQLREVFGLGFNYKL